MLPRRGLSAERRNSKVKDAAPAPTNWRAVWPDIVELMRPRRGQLLLGLALIGISRGAGFVLPASSKYFVDQILTRHNTRLLLPLVAAILVATTIQGLTGYWLTQLLSKSAQRLIAELRCKVERHVTRLPVTFFDSNKSGLLVSRIMNDVEGVRNLVGTGLVEFLGGLLTSIGSFFFLIRLSPLMTLLVSGVGIAYVAVLQKAFRTLRPIFRERGKITSEVSGRLTETLGGIRVVKGYHAEAREDEVFAQGAQRILANVLTSITSIAVLSLSATMLLGVVGALVMYISGREALSTGSFVAFTLFLGFLVAPVFQLVGIGTQLTEALAGLERTRELLNLAREDADPRRSVTLASIRGAVRFEQVSFEYESDKPVLHEVSFEAAPDTVTALVGSSGSGKSTTIGLVSSFHAPREGRVLVDGVDLSTVRLDSYRAQLGVVLQESFLFDGTIRENVAFARPSASAQEVEEACRMARVDEFVERFPDGYDTIVGECGVKLSGGQRQRVSIARAILADPRILILDEATSSLDSETEALIQTGLGGLMRGRTTFVIAHRLSTIRRADQILVMEGGRIIERGNHGELYALRGRYYDLYTRQHGLEANLFLAPGEGDAVPVEGEAE